MAKSKKFDPFDEMAAYQPGRSAHDVAGLRGGVPKPPTKKAKQKKSKKKTRKLSPQEKGWATRRKKAAARSRAAKKAAATRRRNAKLKVWQVEFSYDAHTQGNGYRLIIWIRPGKPLKEDDVKDLAFSLVQAGHFDFQEPIDPESEYSNDYQWISPSQDDAFKIKRRMKPRTARLYGFYRD